MNNESAVFAGLSTLLRTNVITPICTYLQTRQQQGPVTVDELANVLKLPAASPAPSPSPATSFAPMPSGFPGLGAPPALTGFDGMPMPLSAQKKKSSKSASSQPAADHERCIYQITRGVNKGNRCPGKVEAGLQYCTQHKGTRAAQAHMQGGTPQTGQMMPGMQSMPGLPGMSGLPGLPGMSGSAPMMAPTQPQQPRIQVHQVATGLYREAVHGLAIKMGSTPNEYIACGVLADPKSTNITPLTPDKIEYCRQINLAYVDPSRPDAAVVKPTSPSANVSGQTLPPMSQQMPALPSTLPGLPQVQGLGGLPSMGFGAGTAVTDTHHADDPDDDDDDDDLDEDDA